MLEDRVLYVDKVGGDDKTDIYNMIELRRSDAKKVVGMDAEIERREAKLSQKPAKMSFLERVKWDREQSELDKLASERDKFLCGEKDSKDYKLYRGSRVPPNAVSLKLGQVVTYDEIERLNLVPEAKKLTVL